MIHDAQSSIGIDRLTLMQVKLLFDCEQTRCLTPTERIQLNKVQYDADASSDGIAYDEQSVVRWFHAYSNDDGVAKRRSVIDVLLKLLSSESRNSSKKSVSGKRTLSETFSNLQSNTTTVDNTEKCSDLQADYTSILFHTLTYMDQLAMHEQLQFGADFRLCALASLYVAATIRKNVQICTRIEDLLRSQSRSLASLQCRVYESCNYQLNVVSAYDLYREVYASLWLPESVDELHTRYLLLKNDVEFKFDNRPIDGWRVPEDLQRLRQYVECIYEHVVRVSLLDVHWMCTDARWTCIALALATREFFHLCLSTDKIGPLLRTTYSSKLTRPFKYEHVRSREDDEKLDTMVYWPDEFKVCLERARALVCASNDARQFCRI